MDTIGEATSHFGIRKVPIFCAHQLGYDCIVAKRDGERYRIDYPDGHELEMARKQFTVKVNKDNIRHVVYNVFIHGQPTHSKSVQSDWMDLTDFCQELARIVGEKLSNEVVTMLGEDAKVKLSIDKSALLAMIR